MKRLASYLALYVTSCPWVMPAVRANVTFNNANWGSASQGAGLSNVAKAQLDINPYARRAATNDIVQAEPIVPGRSTMRTPAALIHLQAAAQAK
jgi:hypothetical protein